MQCSALLVRVCRLGNARAQGRQWACAPAGPGFACVRSMAPLGAAQSPAPLGCPPMQKSRFSRVDHTSGLDPGQAATGRGARAGSRNPESRVRYHIGGSAQGFNPQ
eukprot:5964685-Prymnesium_polylepis.1